MSTDGRALIENLYAKVLSSSGSTSGDVAAEAERILADDWRSVGNYTGQNKDRAAFTKQMLGFLQLIPDLHWKIEEIIEAGDRYVVRSRASGTPKGALFGVEPSGKKFEIMTMDIHTIRNGRVAITYHVEDWATALAQLRAK